MTHLLPDLPRAWSRAHAPLLLELDVTAELLEEPPADPVSYLRGRRRGVLPAIVRALDEAADDPKVVGLVAKLGSPALSLARAQELAEAVGRFRSGGKPAVAWAETFGEAAPGTASYLLATAFDEIWLQPSGDVGLTGVGAGAAFLRSALDKLGVEPQLDQRYEYKNAADALLRTEFTPAHREATERLVESGFDTVVEAVASRRGLAATRVRELVDRAPLPAAEALATGLVDFVGYRDDVHAELRRRHGEDVRLRYVHRYSRARPPVQRISSLVTRRQRAVAVVTGAGAIRQGASRGGPMAAMGSDTVAAALRAAGADESVAAVVLRVNSPGGSYIASDVIWHEVGRVRAAGKPVVVSMGELAASGGYFVSAGADAIVALPGTLTGSIGVLGGKLVVRELLDRAGVNAQVLARGAHATMASPLTRYDEADWAGLQAWLDRVYDDFVGKVAEGRRLPRERVHELARGRVWTGADAVTHGLIDELGGLGRALALGRERARLPAGAPVRRFPHVPPLARLKRPESSEDPAAALSGASAVAAASLAGAASMLAPAGLEWGPLGGLAAALGLPAAGPLLMPLAPLR